jgi:UDP-N-acetyl-2-amino-2-deoxyglucuronate dehydrogenase
MTAPRSVALVGCGHIAQRHLDALRALPARVKLTAACDPDLDRARATGAPHVAPDLDALLQQIKDGAAPRPDLVALASPSGQHPAQARAAHAAGIDVLCEKPLALTLADTQNMLEAAQQAGRRLFVVQPLRHWPTLHAARSILRDDTIGAVRSASLTVFWSRPQRYFDEAPWRGTNADGGGVLLNQAYHYVDALVWLMGPPLAAQTLSATLARAIEAPDCAAAILRWPGALGTLHATILTGPTNFEASLTLAAEHGVLRLSGPVAERLAVWPATPASIHIDSLHAATDDARKLGHLPIWSALLNVLDGCATDAERDAVDAHGALPTMRLLETFRTAQGSTSWT